MRLLLVDRASNSFPTAQMSRGAVTLGVWRSSEEQAGRRADSRCASAAREAADPSGAMPALIAQCEHGRVEAAMHAHRHRGVEEGEIRSETGEEEGGSSMMWVCPLSGTR